jgi:hypothetical protein
MSHTDTAGLPRPRSCLSGSDEEGKRAGRRRTQQLSGRRGPTKLGFALLLRFYAVHGRFPSGRSELPDQAVAHVARLVDVPASGLGFYEWDGRTVKAHRARLGYDRARILFKKQTGGLDLHQLRHSAATHLGDQKVPLQLIMAKTRHKSPRTVMRYVKPGDEAVAEVTSLLGPPRRTH